MLDRMYRTVNSPLVTVFPLLVDDLECNVFVRRTGGEDQQAGVGIGLVSNEAV